ncbi:ATP-grasp domain-containing protein [Streptomyces rubellomurinus]|uniref:ATP-grasp fold RimK-type domain-containing protein n=1 Tax=Streptomyces rubellomurinus (strain ATCC 31215) TaxID=359131 RepID=A0A0F2T5L8_STRR3|nr:hypothetical protein [Streptomyces rubellomurinus]KJS58504.1 hypothetical protein VM95_32915 [Streptomyces rubellomurinus]
MRVGLIAADPRHPVLAAVAGLLEGQGCEVVHVAPAGGAGDAGVAGELVDVCLLKARTGPALALAREWERRGVPVVNSAAATELCQDRVRMADLARSAGLPFVPTADGGRMAELTWQGRPFVVKSRHSRRHDLVALVDGEARLRELAARWPEEPVVTQPFVPGTGWDQKLWVVDGQVFAARRRSELAAPDGGPEGGEGWVPSAGRTALALRVGEVFGLDVYGVDLLDGPDEPVVVDVNAFPGIRGQAGAPQALAALALRVGAGVGGAGAGFGAGVVG